MSSAHEKCAFMRSIVASAILFTIIIAVGFADADTFVYKSEKDGYTIQFPKQPKIENEKVMGMEMSTALVETAELRLSSVSYKMPDILYNNIHMSKDPDYAIKYQTERQIKRRKDEKFDVKYFHQNGWPASELSFFNGNSKSEIMKTVLIENKVVLCAAISKNPVGFSNEKVKDAYKFLNSLNIAESKKSDRQVSVTSSENNNTVKSETPLANPWIKNGAIILAVVLIGFVWDLTKKKKDSEQETGA